MIEVGDIVTVSGRVVSGLDNRGRVGVQFDGPSRIYSEVEADTCKVEAPVCPTGVQIAPIRAPAAPALLTDVAAAAPVAAATSVMTVGGIGTAPGYTAPAAADAAAPDGA